MATFQKHGKKWRASVCVNRVRRTKVLHTKAQAEAWAKQMEQELESGVLLTGTQTLSDLLLRYKETISTRKESHEREKNRIEALRRDPIADVRLTEFAAPHVSEWKERRLKEVSNSAVRRDWILLSHACNVAVKEWHWLKENPFSQVKRPPEDPSRNRRITDDELERMLIGSGFNYESVTTKTATVGLVMLWAIETAMRAGEICAVTWGDVHDRHVHIPKSKNGFARDIPLSAVALELLEYTNTDRSDRSALVFDINTSQLDALFRKLKKRALIEDLHFHDLRREALSRLSKVFNVMELAKISGHRDLRILQDVYYVPTVDDLADKFN
ncbi:MAG: site-specific integrase [Candidatus Thiodiazotropha taylori]|nr:site-specific integrase [Candidatus Thiodiazotropha taylori]